MKSSGKHTNVDLHGDFAARIAQKAPAGLCVYDLFEERVVYINHFLETYLGYSADKARAMADPVRSMIHPDDFADWLKHTAQLHELTDGESKQFECRIKHADGSYRSIDFHLSVFLRDSSGSVKQLIAAAVDITGRRTAEGASRQTQEQYRVLFESIDEGFCVIEMLFDENGKPEDYRFLQTNPAFEKQTGLQNACGKRMRELAPSHEEHWFQTYGKIALTGEPARFEARAEALRRWYDVYAFRYDGAESRQVGVLFNDVTRRKQTEEALLASQEKYRTLFESIDEGFCVFEMLLDSSGRPVDYRWIETNPAFERHTGLKDAVGRTAREMVPDLDESWFRIYGEVALTGRPARFENYAPAMERWFSVYACRIGEPEQRRVALLFENITVRKKAEQESRLHAEELKRSNQELEQFADVVSHDLQEPLRTVSSYSDYLTETYENLDKEILDALQTIQKGARRAQELIAELLDYSRIGRSGKKFSEVSLGNVLEDVLSDLRTRILEKEAEITFDPLPEVLGDSVQLKRLFQNLISNALKYAEGRVRVRIRAEQRESEWMISIKDDGIGIDLRYADRIFKIFQRLHHEKEFEGTGIGLAVCKKIVERHGGRIWVNSKVGKGSTFYFTLPVSCAAPLL